MKALAALLGMLRLPNLVIVFLSQWMPYYMVLRPAILRGGCVPALDGRMFGLLCANTVLATLAGYLINDIFDAPIDAQNKPNRLVVGRFLSRSAVLLGYVGLLLVVLMLAVYLDLRVFPRQKFAMTGLFAGVSGLLFLYSARLKCTPGLGNVVVAGLCAIVPLVVWYPELRPLQLLGFQDAALLQRTMMTFWNFVVFAFVATLFREMVKDIEDHSGDAACGCHTLPVLRGPRIAKRWAMFVGVLLTTNLVLLIFYWLQNTAPIWKIAAAVLCLLLPAVFASVKTAIGQTKTDFSQASFAIKLLMLAGILLLSMGE